MRNIYLTQEQLRDYLINSLCESFIVEGKKSGQEKDINKFAQRQVGDIISHIMNKAINSGDNSEVMRLANEYGINPEYLKSKGDVEAYNTNYERERERLRDKEQAKEINQWICEYIDELRRCCVGKTFQRDKDSATVRNGIMKTHYAGTGKTYFDSLPQKAKENVLRLKDFLDKAKLTKLYREAPEVRGEYMKYGINLNDISVNTPKDFIYNKIDFTNVDDKEAYNYYKSGTIKKTLDNAAYKLDNTFDKSAKTKDKYEKSEFIRQEAKARKIAQTIDRYMDRKYGVSLTFGKDNNMFKLGNHKIHNDTLIINFESAMRCPAWNECIMKDACYAKTGELNYDDSLSANLKKGFIWTQTKSDPELMDKMCTLMRSCLVNYPAVLIKIIELPSYKEQHVWSKTEFPLNEDFNHEKHNSALELAKMTFAEISEQYGQEALEIIKKNKLGSVVRLNENGDFIGQWLVDAWEKLATDFKLVDIKVAAYTCRALNYTNVKNMILNISQANLVNGQKSEAFAHYFYAITHEEYDKFEETYDGPGYSFRIDPKTTTIHPVYRNLVNENNELAGYYYKCPCGRGKYIWEKVNLTQAQVAKLKPQEYNEFPSCLESGMYIKVNGEYYRSKQDKNAITKADCYMCRICYGRDENEGIVTEDGGAPIKWLPVFVFVATHGINQGAFDGNGQNDHRIVLGKKVDDWIALQQQNHGKHSMNMPQQAKEPAYSVVNEEETNISNSENVGANDNVVINQITQNMVYSVANMMTNRINKLDEIKTNFNKTLKMLEEN